MRDPQVLGPFVGLALDCVHREYPNQLALRMESDEDARPPRELTPAFYGCYDWHSAVHGHWLLCRAARFGVREAECRQRLAVSFEPARLEAERSYIAARPGFERPYGLAWLLQLHAELVEWDDAEARRWRERLSPLADVAVAHFATWLPKLTHPTRSGTHSQTAFALGLVHDWACSLEREDVISLVEDRAHVFFGGDRDYALHLEPSGEDFLSPALGAADLMRRVLAPGSYAEWLERVITVPSADDWLPTVSVSDPTDGRLAHLDGLNLSRAWMLDGIVDVLPAGDSRSKVLARARDRHREAGLAAVDGAHYAGSHWLGTFAAYLITRRGV